MIHHWPAGSDEHAILAPPQTREAIRELVGPNARRRELPDGQFLIYSGRGEPGEIRLSLSARFGVAMYGAAVLAEPGDITDAPEM